MKSILGMVGRGLLCLLMGAGTGVASAAAGGHVTRGELIRLSPDGNRVGYVEPHGDYTMLWVSSVINPEDRRPVMVWGAEDQAFDWADNAHLAIARRTGDNTVLTIMSADGDGEPIQSPLLSGGIATLHKDSIDSIVVTSGVAAGDAIRYDSHCNCFAAGPDRKDAPTVPPTPGFDGIHVWSASWDGNVLLVSRAHGETLLPVYVYSPHTKVARTLFAASP